MSNSPIVLDIECTSFNKGHPYDPRNILLWIGMTDGSDYLLHDIEFSGRPYGETLESIQSRINRASCVVAFAGKIDIAWCRRYGIDFSKIKFLDLQAAEFILSGQTIPMSENSLDLRLTARGLPNKVPFDFDREHTEAEWREYLHQDLHTEYLLFKEIQKDLAKVDPRLKRLIFDDSQDILITQEMEWNGLKYDIEKSRQLGDGILQEIGAIDQQLQAIVPFPWVNWASGDHLSAILFGGVAKYDQREKYTITLKSGAVKEKEHWVSKEYIFPRLVEPLEKVKKEGYFKVDEGTLLKLKAKGQAKEIIDLILKRSKLEKKVGTYYHGIPKLYEEMGWQDGLLHGQLHHVVARTGRLSSSKPNLQNIEDSVRSCIISRF